MNKTMINLVKIVSGPVAQISRKFSIFSLAK